MDYALKLNQFEELSYSELMAVDGGYDLALIAEGAGMYFAATLGFLAITGPIGWGIALAYLGCCACAGILIGLGIIG